MSAAANREGQTALQAPALGSRRLQSSTACEASLMLERPPSRRARRAESVDNRAARNSGGPPARTRVGLAACGAWTECSAPPTSRFRCGWPAVRNNAHEDRTPTHGYEA